jgi:acetyl-CoA synthetase
MSTSDSILEEPQAFLPHASVAAYATISGMDAYRALVAEAERDYAGFWARLARETLDWKKPFSTVLDESRTPFYEWFNDGTVNASYNCLDRHVEAGNGEHVALIFEADDGTVTHVTYRQLLKRVSRFANALRTRGVGKGDRVVIYMPMSIEGIVAMRACASARRIPSCSAVFRRSRSMSGSSTWALSRWSPATNRCAAAKRFR